MISQVGGWEAAVTSLDGFDAILGQASLLQPPPAFRIFFWLRDSRWGYWAAAASSDAAFAARQAEASQPGLVGRVASPFHSTSTRGAQRPKRRRPLGRVDHHGTVRDPRRTRRAVYIPRSSGHPERRIHRCHQSGTFALAPCGRWVTRGGFPFDPSGQRESPTVPQGLHFQSGVNLWSSHSHYIVSSKGPQDGKLCGLRFGHRNYPVS